MLVASFFFFPWGESFQFCQIRGRFCSNWVRGFLHFFSKWILLPTLSNEDVYIYFSFFFFFSVSDNRWFWWWKFVCIDGDPLDLDFMMFLSNEVALVVLFCWQMLPSHSLTFLASRTSFLDYGSRTRLDCIAFFSFFCILFSLITLIWLYVFSLF